VSAFWIEAVGYAGSALVILSLMQKSILRLRTVGLVASATFLVYSLAIEAYPIAVVNVVAAAIHTYFLRKLVRRKSEVFKLLEVDPDSRYLEYFLDFYARDIETGHNSGFQYIPGPKTLPVLLLRDMVPAGVLIANVHGDSSFEILIDYVIPQYRDFKLARWLYSHESGIFMTSRCHCAWTRADTPAKEEYFTTVGFKPDRVPAVPDRYAFVLPASA
jgi:hypothetical protein